MKEYRMCKNDIILLMTIFLIALIGLVLLYSKVWQKGSVLYVREEGQAVHRYFLSEDQRIQINGGSNIAQIKDGKVYMVYADCPDQICVSHRPIDRKGEQIICLPNRVILQIQGDEEAEFDSVTN